MSGAEYPMIDDGNYRFKVQGSRLKGRDAENIAYIFYLTPCTLYHVAKTQWTRPNANALRNPYPETRNLKPYFGETPRS